MPVLHLVDYIVVNLGVVNGVHGVCFHQFLSVGGVEVCAGVAEVFRSGPRIIDFVVSGSLEVELVFGKEFIYRLVEFFLSVLLPAALQLGLALVVGRCVVGLAEGDWSAVVVAIALVPRAIVLCRWLVEVNSRIDVESYCLDVS